MADGNNFAITLNHLSSGRSVNMKNKISQLIFANIFSVVKMTYFSFSHLSLSLSLSMCVSLSRTHTHTHTHARTHSRTHARTHTHTHTFLHIFSVFIGKDIQMEAFPLTLICSADTVCPNHLTSQWVATTYISDAATRFQMAASTLASIPTSGL